MRISVEEEESEGANRQSDSDDGFERESSEENGRQVEIDIRLKWGSERYQERDTHREIE